MKNINNGLGANLFCQQGFKATPAKQGSKQVSGYMILGFVKKPDTKILQTLSFVTLRPETEIGLDNDDYLESVLQPSQDQKKCVN